MPSYRVKLKRREEVAEGTMAFLFEKPIGIQFRAGQYLNLTLIDPPETDADGNTRTLSIASSPLDDNLMVATRMRDSAFKRVLKNLSIGTAVHMAGPFGSFNLHQETTRPAVFLAGGIGITPFLSILRQAVKSQLSHRLLLFYSNRRPEDAAFLQELQQMEGENKNYRFIGIMTDMKKSHRPWQGETGRIDRNIVARFVEDLFVPIYYMAGPPTMVSAMRGMLAGAGVNDDQLRSEEFAGY